MGTPFLGELFRRHSALRVPKRVCPFWVDPLCYLWFYPYALREISVLTELALGHLR